MNNNKKFQLENDIVLEFQDNTTPLARFEEYIRYSEQLRSGNSVIDSTEVD